MTDATLSLEYEQGFVKILVVSASFMVCMYYFDLYDFTVLSNPREVLTRIVEVLGTLCVLLALLYHIFPPLELGRGILVVGFILLGTLLLLWRRIFLTLITLAQFAENTLILGDGPLAAPLVLELESRPTLGMRVVGQLLTYGNGDNLSDCKSDALSEDSGGIAPQDELVRVVEALNVNRIVIAIEV